MMRVPDLNRGPVLPDKTYASDSIKRTDNQRWQAHHPDINHKPAAALQPSGLVDTMNDLLMGLIGASAASVVWYFLL